MIKWIMKKLGYTKIKKIVIATIGNDTYPATPKQLKSLAKAFEDIENNTADKILWNHTLSVKTIEI